MSVDWTGETVAWVVLVVSGFYLADRLVVWLVTRFLRRPRAKPGKQETLHTPSHLRPERLHGQVSVHDDRNN